MNEHGAPGVGEESRARFREPTAFGDVEPLGLVRTGAFWSQVWRAGALEPQGGGSFRNRDEGGFDGGGTCAVPSATSAAEFVTDGESPGFVVEGGGKAQTCAASGPS